MRVAGLDTGHVVDVNFVEVEGSLRARVRLSLPVSLVKKFRQDVKVTISPALTGMSHVNIVSTGRMGVALVPGQLIPGVETSFFDPIIEQVGSGPRRAKPLEPHDRRSTPDGRFHRAPGAAGTRLAPGHSVEPARVDRIDPAAPRIDRRQCRGTDPAHQHQSPQIRVLAGTVDDLAGQTQAYLSDNRENVRMSVTSVRDLTASMNDIVAKDRVKVERLLDGLEVTERAPTGSFTRAIRSPAAWELCWLEAVRRLSDR